MGTAAVGAVSMGFVPRSGCGPPPPSQRGPDSVPQEIATRPLAVSEVGRIERMGMATVMAANTLPPAMR